MDWSPLFDIKADVLVSLALIASVFIGEDFAAGEVAFIMQLGKPSGRIDRSPCRAGIEKLVHLTPQTARGSERVELNRLFRHKMFMWATGSGFFPVKAFQWTV